MAAAVDGLQAPVDLAGGWGHTWQSSMAAGFLGLSAWLVRDDLPP